MLDVRTWLLWAISMLAAETASSALMFLVSAKCASSGRPRMPPMALISSMAISMPALPESPSDAAPPVSGSMEPIGIGSPLAARAPLAPAMTDEVSTAPPTPSVAAPARSDRLLRLGCSTPAPELPDGWCCLAVISVSPSCSALEADGRK